MRKIGEDGALGLDNISSYVFSVQSKSTTRL